MYTGKKYSGMKSSVCFALKFAISPFSPHLPFGVQISKQNRHRTFHTRIFFTGVHMGGQFIFGKYQGGASGLQKVKPEATWAEIVTTRLHH